MKNRKVMSTLATVVTLGMVLSSQAVFADDYPTHTTATDANSVTMTNKIEWQDATHASNNYNANLDITINGLTETKTYNEPIDVQVVHDISASMDYRCYADNHYTFGYKKDAKDAFSESDFETAIKPLVNTKLNELLNGKVVTSKDDWIPLTPGMSDTEGNPFTSEAYLVPKVSFYKSEGNIVPSEPETNYYVVDKPLPGATSASDFYPYWVNFYHASKDASGKYHTLCSANDPTTAMTVNFTYFDRDVSRESGCKTYSTTAYNLLTDLADELYTACPDTHMSISSFCQSVKYTSEFTDDLTQFSDYISTAFNQSTGATNYEAALLKGKENLEAHTDNDARKRVIIFISDGRPNNALDADGNIKDTFESEDLKRLIGIADDIKASGTEIYTVGYCIDEWINTAYLKPLATDDNHSYYRLPDQLDNMLEIYGLIEQKVITDTYIKATVETAISQYYEVDKNNLPAGVSVIEEEKTLADGSKRNVQTIKYNVKTEDLDSNGINTTTIPVILKEQYRNTTGYYPINDEELNGSNASYEMSDRTQQNISVKTTWLDVETKKDDTPIDPETPVDPDKPVDPETPVNPEKPDTTITPEVTDNTKPNTTTETTTTNKNSSVKTSDDIQTNKYLVISLISLSGLLAILCKTRYDFKNI